MEKMKKKAIKFTNILKHNITYYNKMSAVSVFSNQKDYFTMLFAYLSWYYFLTHLEPSNKIVRFVITSSV